MKVAWHGAGFSKILSIEKARSRIGIDGNKISFAFDFGANQWNPFAVIYWNGVRYEETLIMEWTRKLDYLFEGLRETNQQKQNLGASNGNYKTS
jgi:hypothetical protein